MVRGANPVQGVASRRQGTERPTNGRLVLLMNKPLPACMRVVVVLLCLAFAGLSGCATEQPTAAVVDVPPGPPMVSLSHEGWARITVPAGPEGGYAAFILNNTATSERPRTGLARDRGVQLAIDPVIEPASDLSLTAWAALAFVLTDDGPVFAGGSLAGDAADRRTLSTTNTTEQMDGKLLGLEAGSGSVYRYLPGGYSPYLRVAPPVSVVGQHVLIVLAAASDEEESINMAIQRTNGAPDSFDREHQTGSVGLFDLDFIIPPLVSGSGFSMGFWSRYVLAGVVQETSTPTIQRQAVAPTDLLAPGVQAESYTVQGDGAGWGLIAVEASPSAGIMEYQTAGHLFGQQGDAEGLIGPNALLGCIPPVCLDHDVLRTAVAAAGGGGYDWRIDLLGVDGFVSNVEMAFVRLDLDFELLGGQMEGQFWVTEEL